MKLNSIVPSNAIVWTEGQYFDGKGMNVIM